MTTSTPLRQRLIEDMQLHGFAAKMQDCRAPAPAGTGLSGRHEVLGFERPGHLWVAI